eukprot:Rhum_TRINITY_DN14076_c1_g1::Rhum_TRINITY_DN14076_c1_g1_i2::g.68530::m.68530
MGAWELQHPLPVGGLVEAADAAGTWWTVTVVDVIGDREYRTEVDDGPGTVWESVGAENMRLPSSAEKELEGLQADLDAAERRKDEARCVEIEEKMATAQRGGVRTLRKGDAVDVKNRLDGEWRPGTVHAVGPPPSVDIGHGIASFAHVRLSQDSLAHPLSVGDACEALDAEGTWWPVSVRRVLSGTSYAVTVDDGARTEWPEVLAQNMRRARAKKIGKELTKEKEGGGRRSRGDRDKDKDGGGRRRKDGHRRRRASSSGSSAASSSGGASSSSGRRGGGGGAASPASSSRRLKASSKKDKKEKKKKGSSSRGGKDGDKRDRKDKKRARRSDNRSSEDEEGGAAGAARSSSHPHQHHHHHHHRGATASLVKGDVVSWWASDVQRLRRGVVVSSKTCRLEGGETVGIPPEAARVDAGFLPVPLTAVSAVRRAAAVEAALDGADGLRLTRDGAGHGAKPALAVLSLALPPDAPDTRFTFHLETACRLRKCDPPASANEPGPLTIGLVRADVAAAAGGRGSGASGHHHSGRGVQHPLELDQLRAGGFRGCYYLTTRKKGEDSCEADAAIVTDGDLSGAAAIPRPTTDRAELSLLVSRSDGTATWVSGGALHCQGRLPRDGPLQVFLGLSRGHSLLLRSVTQACGSAFPPDVLAIARALSLANGGGGGGAAAAAAAGGGGGRGGRRGAGRGGGGGGGGGG